MRLQRRNISRVIVGIGFATIATSAAAGTITIGGPYMQTGQLDSPDTFTAFQQFGYSVAIAKDDAVVTGLDEESSGVPDVANIFSKGSAGAWSYVSSPPQPDGGGSSAGGPFASCNSVAINGSMMVTGQPQATEWPQSFAGEVDIYEKRSEGWQFTDTVVDPDHSFGERFGCGLAMSENTLVVGAGGDDFTGGGAYVYVKSGSEWVRQAKLTTTDNASRTFFALSIAIDGDTIVVGAPRATNMSGKKSGAAYLYTRTGTTWSGIKLEPADGADNDSIGATVAVSGNTVLVGAPTRSVGTTSQAGTVYAYSRAGSSWNLRAEIEPPIANASGFFGSAVAAAFGRLIIGESGAPKPSVHIYWPHSGSWVRSGILISDANTAFGFAIGTSATSSEFIVGAPNEGAGHAYTFDSDDIFAGDFE